MPRLKKYGDDTKIARTELSISWRTGKWVKEIRHDADDPHELLEDCGSKKDSVFLQPGCLFCIEKSDTCDNCAHGLVRDDGNDYQVFHERSESVPGLLNRDIFTMSAAKAYARLSGPNYRGSLAGMIAGLSSPLRIVED